MKRKITSEDVRRFFESAERQFRESGFVLHGVRFVRSSDDKEPLVRMHYSEVEPKTEDER
jgi:hypothetical protein